ncbi:MAG: choice-of-anchor B family protein [Gemmatimonadota bacterium]
MRRQSILALAAVTAAAAAGLFATVSDAEAQEPNFGRAIALAGSDLVIGQPVNWYGPGTVYSYRLDESGQWQETERLTASDAERKDDFGRAVALDGNTLAVGAPRKHDGSGVVYLFDRDAPGAEWRQTAIVEPPGEGDFSEYGAALVLSGADDLFVGAAALDTTGAVHHFRRGGDGWTLHATLTPEDGDDAASFGAAMSVRGDWLLIGAPGSDEETGRVYFFRRGAGGDWTEAQAVSPPGSVAGEEAGVGSSVLLDGERAFVGAPGENAVFVLERDEADRWTPASVGPLLPFDGVRRAGFGRAIASVGDEVWVGAPGASGAEGRAYRFVPDGDGGWRSSEAVDAATLAGMDGDDERPSWPFAFGFSIAASGERIVVGMPFGDFGEGRVVAVERDGEDWRGAQTLMGEIHRLGEDLASGDRCEDGRMGEFPCTNIELVSHMPTSALGGERGAWVNDVWGWTDAETGRDYALVARRDGASFVDVTDPSAPRLVGDLPRTRGSRPTVWRDIKVIGDHAYVVSDGAGEHGMQVFDLTRLRDVGDEPMVFEPDTTYHEIHSAHNVVADAESGFLYIVGANGGGETCGGGLHMVDARVPLEPTFAGCYNDSEGANSRGYTHDAQCVVYRGPDAEYRGRQICVGSNEREINIADVTDKESPATIGRGTYPDAAYTHQGWFDEEQRYFYQNDELDEIAGNVEGTRTIVWDLTELDDPIVANQYIGPVNSSDHNLYVNGERVYESNYGSGLRVLDISDRANPREVAFFDSAPYNDDGPGTSASQSGAWSNYPFFEDGLVVFTSVREGLFIVRVAEETPVS